MHTKIWYRLLARARVHPKKSILPSGKTLTDREFGAIFALQQENKTLSQIVSSTNRSRTAIHKLQTLGEQYNKIKRFGQKLKLSPHYKRSLFRASRQTGRESKFLQHSLHLSVSAHTMRRILPNSHEFWFDKPIRTFSLPKNMKLIG